MPEGMDQVMFGNSGAEAVENAVKLAKQATRRPGIIAFQGAFHGRTHLTMALTDSAVHYRGHMEPLMGGIYHARYCYPYRTPASEDPTDYAIEDVRRVLRAEIVGDDVAAIIVEPIQGEGGFIVPTAEFMHGAARHRRRDRRLPHHRRDPGRHGPHRQVVLPRALRRQAGHPDDAKGIASGYPLAAIAARGELWDKCMPGSMGGTYGGNAVACAAGVATIEAMKEEGMLENAARQGEKLRRFFTRHAGDLPVHRRGPRQGPHGRHRVRRAGHQGAQRAPPPRRSSPSASSGT